MREDLLRWIVCPACSGDLACAAAERDGQTSHILEGRLVCSACSATYPITRGVPRLLADSGGARVIEETKERFGFEWNQFKDYSVNNFDEFVRPLPEGFFKGKAGLDAGCGAGRHALRAAALGGRVIGMDLSSAVDAAFENTRSQALVDILQGDIMRPPIRKNSLDFIYSLGVLQHLPEPRKGYLGLVPLLKSGGSLFVWVYQRSLRKVLLEIPRCLTTRLSPGLIKIAAGAATLIDHGLFCAAYRLLRSVRPLRPAAELLFPARTREYAGYSFRDNWTDWYDRLAAPITHAYTEKDILEWTREAGLGGASVSAVGDSWIWAVGKKKALAG